MSGLAGPELAGPGVVVGPPLVAGLVGLLLRPEGRQELAGRPVNKTNTVLRRVLSTDTTAITGNDKNSKNSNLPPREQDHAGPASTDRPPHPIWSPASSCNSRWRPSAPSGGPSAPSSPER